MKIEVGDYVLREYSIEDAADLYEILSDKERSWWFGWGRPLADLDDAKGYIEYWMDGAGSYDSYEETVFAIVNKGKVMGVISVSKDKLEKTAEFGYVIHPDYEGQGIMPQIVNALSEELFLNDDIDTLIISAMECNKRSCRVAEKCGFHKTEDIGYRTDGRELVIYNLSREDFMSKLSEAA